LGVNNILANKSKGKLVAYYKSNEQVTGEAIGGIIGLIIRFIVWCMLYSPFVFAFGFTFKFTQETYNLHGFVSSILGLLSAAALFFLVGAIYTVQQVFKNKKNKTWLLLSLLNLILIAGLPFLIGMSFGLDFLDNKITSLFEKIIAGGFGGLVLAIPAYIGVTKNFKLDPE